MARIDGKVAFITGAGRGIGRVAAVTFARAGASIVVADVDDAGGAATVEQVASAGGTAHFVHVDVTDDSSVRTGIAEAVATFGHLDILYNNAGGSTARENNVVDIDLEEFWHAIKFNLFGTVLCCRHAIPHLRAAGGGTIVNTSSVVAHVGTPDLDGYTAAKGGVAALTRSLAARFAQDGIRVNAVAPSATRTERVVTLLEARPVAKEHYEKLHRLGLVEPEDVADAALYLASDGSRRTTGHILFVDSGLLAT